MKKAIVYLFFAVVMLYSILLSSVRLPSVVTRQDAPKTAVVTSVARVRVCKDAEAIRKKLMPFALHTVIQTRDFYEKMCDYYIDILYHIGYY